MSPVWSITGKSVQHESGLIINIVEGTLTSPLDIDVRNSTNLSAAEVATLVRVGLEFAASEAKASGTQVSRRSKPVLSAAAKEQVSTVNANRPKRKMLKLNRKEG